MTDRPKKQARKKSLCKRTRKNEGSQKKKYVEKKNRVKPTGKGPQLGDVVDKSTAQTMSTPRRSVSTRRQKSTLTRLNKKTGPVPKCGPGTVVTEDGKCVPATAGNVFGMTKTTSGRTPIPADYSCEFKKPTSDTMKKIIVYIVQNNPFEGETIANNQLSLAAAIVHTKGLIFEHAD